MPYDWKFVYSENDGMSTSRNGIFFSVAVNSRSPNSIGQVISNWLWAKYPKEMAGHSFTSITVNSDFSAKLHRDRNNAGLSLITAIRNCTGGKSSLLGGR